MNVFTRFWAACLLSLSVASVQATTPPTTSAFAEGLILSEPAYDCATRQLTIRATGGNGSAIEYMVAGQSRWSTSPTLVIDAVFASEANHIMLFARQRNATGAPTVSSRTFNIAAVCGGGKITPAAGSPAKSTGLNLTGLTYDCGSRQLSVQTTGGNGTGIDYMVAGQSSWVNTPSFTIDANVATQVPVLMVLARQQSETGTPYIVKQILDLGQRCGNDKTNASAPNATPTGLTLSTPSYDCTTGQLTIRTSGGNGAPIEYLVAGQGRWSTSATVLIEPTAISDNGSLVILARQKNAQGVPTVAQQSVNTRELCNGR